MFVVVLVAWLSFLVSPSVSHELDSTVDLDSIDSIQTLVWQLESLSRAQQYQDEHQIANEVETDAEFDEDAALLESAAIIHQALTAEEEPVLDTELIETQGQQIDDRS